MTRPAVGEQTTLAERKRRAAQRLILGFEGVSPSADFKAFVAEAAPAGFILFARNIEEPAQVAELNRELASMVPCLLYTSPSPRDRTRSRMPSSA